MIPIYTLGDESAKNMAAAFVHGLEIDSTWYRVQGTQFLIPYP